MPGEKTSHSRQRCQIQVKKLKHLTNKLGPAVTMTAAMTKAMSKGPEEQDESAASLIGEDSGDETAGRQREGNKREMEGERERDGRNERSTTAAGDNREFNVVAGRLPATPWCCSWC